jgi:predicted HAD superfamily hydrolase
VYKLSLIEFLMTSPEPPLEYIENGIPCYKEFSAYEKARSEAYTHIADGIIDYVNDIISIFGGKSVFISYKEVKNWLNIFIDFPGATDRQKWRGLKRAVDFGHDDYAPIFPEWYEKKVMIIKMLFRRFAYSSNFMFYTCINIMNIAAGLKSTVVRRFKNLFLKQR